MAGLSLEMGACTGSSAEGAVGGTGRAIKSLATWKAPGVDGTVKRRCPLPLPRVRDGSLKGLMAVGGKISSNPSWASDLPNVDPLIRYTFSSLFDAGN